MVVASDGPSGGERPSPADDDTEDMSTEQLFELRGLPTWTEQITVRAIAVSFIVGCFLSVVVMKLSLSTGMIPSLNVCAGLIGFLLVKSWCKFLQRAGFDPKPFTRQENTVIQTCVVACSTIAFSGGFASNLLAMSTLASDDMDKINHKNSIKYPSLGWMTAFLFLISFVGLFAVSPLRQRMIIGYNLPFPTGTATAHLINSFHTPQGALLARKQIAYLFKSFFGALSWSMFTWLYEGGHDCGFSAFPTFGLKAFRNTFYFDFNPTLVGVGMICPAVVNISLLIGSFFSWGFLWPLIRSKKGQWYRAELPENSLHGLAGYQVFIAIALVLGDSLFHFFTIFIQTIYDMHVKSQKQGLRANSLARVATPSGGADYPAPEALSFDDHRRIKVFLKDKIPTRLLAAGYAGLAIVSIVFVPYIFPQLRPYHVAAVYIVAPFLAFSNAYGTGLTDFTLSSQYGKLAIFVIGSWVGERNGGVIAGLAASGVMLGIVSTASDIMQDFKTGYMTLSSQRSMLASQAIGTAMGCVINPIIFMMFYKAYPLGEGSRSFPAPYAKIYRGLALIGVQGVSSLPKNCVAFCVIAFLAGIGINTVKEFAKYMRWPIAAYVPNAMGIAVPFYIGGYFSIDMCVGGLIMLLWQKVSLRDARMLGPAVASGLICGSGMSSLPQSLMALFDVRSPMCMKFLSERTNISVDQFLKNHTKGG